MFAPSTKTKSELAFPLPAPTFFFSPLQLFFIHQVKFPPMFLRETFAPLSLGCQRLQEERSPCAAVGKWRKYWSLGRAVKDCRTWLSAVWTSCRKQDWNQEMIQRQFVTSRKAATSLYIKTWEKTLWSLFCQLSLLVCSFQVSQGSERAMWWLLQFHQGFISCSFSICSPFLLKMLGSTCARWESSDVEVKL